MKMPEPTFTVQEWLAHPMVPTINNKPLRYAKWWINKHLTSIHEKLSTLDFDGGHRLYVTYAGIRHRVMGVDRLGVIDLSPLIGNNLDRYKSQMVRETDFTDWSNTFEGPLDESKFVPYVPSVVERLNATNKKSRLLTTTY